ncbi:DUF4301 family protein [Patiriisocius sp. Uisw_017]|jgi:hypothetical protein|uniref:DUF4301 family protein n=1 Tax=Patiriisocius sp. Uisw_017 TaxID=3230968 RepID=UPI0039EAF8F4
MFNRQDLQQFEAQGLDEEKVKNQLRFFKKGTPFVAIVTAAGINNGIESPSEKELNQLASYYSKHKQDKDIVNFVPASGAATRMFNFLHTFLEGYDPEEELLSSYIKINKLTELDIFFRNLKHFPFIKVLRTKIRELYPDYKKSNKGVRMFWLVKTLLTEDGLGYSKLPKGLIPFHKYLKYSRTAFEEQLYEATQYAAAYDNVHLHFTFSPQHIDLFKEAFKAIENKITKKTKIGVKISFSFQECSTDTIAVNRDDSIYRDEKGALVFRPSGHGALLNNLNNVDADIVFIKNIDNVVAEEYLKSSVKYKRMLAGKLLKVQSRIFSYLEEIMQRNVPNERLSEMKSFLWNELNIKEIPNTEAGIADILNRPIRVCGVVENTGSPGGGPFWVKDVDGCISLQIVEMSQIDKEDFRQLNIVNEATHFNPVDIVCGIRNCKGEKFNLHHYSNPDACFISNKTIEGKPIKALELPGLWNGGMAKWNTIFMEVPIETFNPVKTVNDLLRPRHQPNA